jgi:NADPH:quinone reductase-like Zn-dependent oxidoreductase
MEGAGDARGCNPVLKTFFELIKAGKIDPLIDRRYPLTQTAVIACVEEGHARAKVLITFQ